MFKITRDVYVSGTKVGTMEVCFDGDVTITHTSSETAEVQEIVLPIETADVMYDLMTLARPTHDGGQSY